MRKSWTHPQRNDYNRPMTQSFLDKVYSVKGADATRDLYDAWSQSYEAEVAQNGYATPGRAAEALANTMDDQTLPILDFGCGTGLSGLALRIAGFTQIDGVDLSADMLEQAKAKGIYRRLSQIEADGPLPDTSDHTAITAIGVIGAGAAPVSVLDTLFSALRAGGYLCFSFNDHTLEDPVFEARVQALIDSEVANQISRDYGDHLPGLNMNSVVYVLKKT